MEFRRQFRSSIEDEIRVARSTIKQNESAVESLTRDKQPFRTVELVAKAKAKIVEFKGREKHLLKQLEDIDAGLFDSQLEEERKTAAIEVKAKAQKKLEKAPKKSPIHKTKKEKEKERRQNFVERKSFVTEREAAIEYERLMRSCERLPPKLAERLEKMPGNHGIIFNGIWFFGKQVEKKPYDTVVLQDKQGDKFYVHYYSSTQHSLYVKEGYGRNTREVLVSREKRQRFRFGFMEDTVFALTNLK